MQIALCGRVALGGGDSAEAVISRPQVQLCLAVLVLERHRPVGREELAHLLWGDRLSAHWQGAIRGVLAKVRDALQAGGGGRDVLTASAGFVHLMLPADTDVDVERARRLVQAAEDGLAREGADQARSSARHAVDLLAGRFLPAVDCQWADARRAELDQLERRGARALASAEIGVGRPAEAIAPLRRLLERDPFDEGSQILLLRALAAAGERTQALVEHEAYVHLLEAELGVRPSPELSELGDELRELHAPPAVPTARPASGRSTPHRPPTAAGPFVGRGDERRTLLSEVVRADADRPSGVRVVVVEGEQGVGKTALAIRLAEDARGAGARVVWGRCSAHGSEPFEPVTEALAGCLDDPGCRQALAGLEDDLTPALSAAAGRPGSRPGESSRAAIFRTVEEAFRRLAAAPAVWIIDDLQWATSDTLALFAHVVRHAGEVPLTVVCTCRERRPEVASTLAEVARVVPLRVVGLGGIDVEAVAEWLTEAAIPAEQGLADRLWARTGGNPLFVWHLVGAAHETGGRLDPEVIPPALDAFLGERIAALGPDAVLALSAAAVAGSVVPVDVLAAVTALPEPTLLTAIDDLVRARLINDEGDALRFTHGLVEDAVIARLGRARRSWFHRRTAEALEVVEARVGRTGTAAEIARHYAAAGEHHGDEARRWALVAADEALDQAAWGAASRHAASVLAATTAAPDDRVAALIAGGRARRGLGDHDGAGDALREALDLARLHDLPRRFAEAVLHLVGGGGRGIPDDARYRRVALVEEALERLDEVNADDDLRIPLLGALANTLLLTDRDADRTRCAADALRLARRYGDATLLAPALLDHRHAVPPERIEQRMAELAEAFELAAAHDLPEVAITALVYRLEVSLSMGSRDAARDAAREAERRLERYPHPYWSWSLATWQVIEQALDGDLATAEERAVEALASERHRADAVACHGVNLVMIRMHEGRPGDIVGLLDRAARDHPEIPCYRAVLSLATAEAGDLERARHELDWFARDHLRGLPDDTNRLLALAMLAETSARLDDPTLADVLVPELERYAGQQVILNCYGGGGATWGPVSAHLAHLAALRGDDDGGRHWYERAVADAERIGDRPFLDRLRRGGSASGSAARSVATGGQVRGRPC